MGDLAIGLAIIEMTERVELRYLKGKYIREEEFMLGRTRSSINDGWTSTKDLPSGRLRLVAYSPCRNAKLAKQWQETKAVKLNARIGAIVRLIKSMAPEMEALRGEARRQEEFRRKEYEFAEDKRRRAEDKRQIEQSIKDSRDHLNKVNIQWSETQGIVRFLQGVEEAANNLPNAEREVVLSRLQLAEEFLGAQDPLQHFLKW